MRSGLSIGYNFRDINMPYYPLYKDFIDIANPFIINSNISQEDFKLIEDLVLTKDVSNLILAGYILGRVKGTNIVDKIYYKQEFSKLLKQYLK